ncbi:hypothetical protein [Nonomuraea zeae]|uniref:Uncharacterized protein n=1 Tax=Nonomuraea zeae TaxID=1642303 RepID=A0A5S4H1Y6_9ACTN|nr:hypothetical protein [Nonomuraea zeae]TMR39197.1 hypothetical protein ETD85_02170 [Nonomuraea zeae]
MPIAARRSRAAAALLLTTLAAVLMAVPAGASTADIPNYTHASDTSEWSSDDKGAEATCPGGTHVLSGGAWIGDAPGASVSGDIVIDEIIPSADKVKVFGVEGNSTGNSWTITAWAVCGSVHGAIRTRSLETSHSSPPYHEMTVTCEPGEWLLGSGYELEGARGGARMGALIPTLNSVYGAANEKATTYNADWSLRVFATCADEPPPGLWLYSETSPSNAEPKRVEAACGGAGDRQVALGSGFDIDGGLRGGIVLDGFYSINTLSRVETAEMHGDDNDWSVTAYVICAWED